RPGEKNGRDYYFLSKQEFQSLIRSGGLVEWAVVHGNYYGTPKAPLKKNIALGRDVILNIDVQGGFSVKKHFNNSVLIFVMAPSFKDLEKRLKGRGQDSEEVIRRRLLNAKNEIACLKKYEYLVINDKLNRAALEIEAIILAEHRRVRNISNTSFKK
ncbi:MAG: guanylate kinase, partial [Elusimicrobia bacterium RIFOXYB1_FULL_48_9]